MALLALAIAAVAGAYGLGSRRATTETTITPQQTGTETWDDENVEALMRRHPRLAGRFR